MEQEQNNRVLLITSSFLSFLKKYKNKKVVLSTHRHPDVDGIASAFALGSLFPNATYALQDSPAEDTQPLIEKLGMKFVILNNLNKEEYEGLIILDCHSYTMIKDAKDWNILAIIDHHADESKNIHAPFEIIEPDSTSNVEVIAKIHPNITKEVAFAIAVGIISDTARFKSARDSTFETLSKMMKLCGASYKELYLYAYPQEPVSKRRAILAAFQRVEDVEYKGNLIAFSHVGTNESMASTLLSEAADYAFVASEKHNETRISARAGSHAKVKMNEVLFEVGKRLNGAGGGHAKAAGASVQADLKTALDTCVTVLKEFLDKVD